MANASFNRQHRLENYQSQSKCVFRIYSASTNPWISAVWEWLVRGEMLALFRQFVKTDIVQIGD